MKKYINIGVVGAGHLGKIHLKLLNQSNLFKVLGFYDINSTVRKEVSRELGLKSYKSLKNLIDDVDAIDIVTPTENHFEIAKQSINKLKHVFIEKPVTKSIEEANELLRLSKINNVKVQIGHIERFNPAYKAAKKYLNDIKFIETYDPLLTKRYKLKYSKPEGISFKNLISQIRGPKILNLKKGESPI